MVKVNPEKKDLVSGFSAPPEVFHSMHLEVGDIFENKHGISLKVEPSPFSDKLQVQALEETELEKATERILTHRFGFEAGVDFTKQYYPTETSKQYSIDFAFPILRLAVEPHGSHLWELNDGNEAEKEQDLNEAGWDVLWFDENDLEGSEQVAAELRHHVTAIIEGLEFREDGVQIIKSLPRSRRVVEYNLRETVEQAGLPSEAADTVVYDGEVVPRPIGKLFKTLSDRTWGE